MKNVREKFCAKFLPYVFYCRGVSTDIAERTAGYKYYLLG